MVVAARKRTRRPWWKLLVVEEAGIIVRVRAGTIKYRIDIVLKVFIPAMTLISKNKPVDRQPQNPSAALPMKTREANLFSEEASAEAAEVDQEEELNPFVATEDSLFDADDPPTRRRLRRPRNWGIPTFEQQCNGVNTFVLKPDNATGGKNEDDGVTLTLEHRRNSTGSDLWDAALVLAHALSRPGIVRPDQKSTSSFIPNVLQGMTVLELGSGTGAVGLYAAKCLGAEHVILTDLPDNLELLERNRQANDLQDKITLVALDWLDHGRTPSLLDPFLPDELLPPVLLARSSIDLILGSDLFLPFATHLLDPLARTLVTLLEMAVMMSPSLASPQALICYEERFDVSPFWEAAERYGLVIEKVDAGLLNPTYQDADYIHLLRITLAK